MYEKLNIKIYIVIIYIFKKKRKCPLFNQNKEISIPNL